MARARFIAVQKSLSGVSYPASKQQLVEHARGKKADKDTIEALEHLPDQEYGRPSDVSKAVAKS
jgi:Protein of unknown function (DUF2795)